MSSQSVQDELAALRQLEAAVRSCGLPAVMVSGQRQLELLADALRAVGEARATTALTTCTDR